MWTRSRGFAVILVLCLGGALDAPRVLAQSETQEPKGECPLELLAAYGRLQIGHVLVTDVATRRIPTEEAWDDCISAIEASHLSALRPSGAWNEAEDGLVRALLEGPYDGSTLDCERVERTVQEDRILEVSRKSDGFPRRDLAPQVNPEPQQLRLTTENHDVLMDPHFAARGYANITAGEWPIMHRGLEFGLYPLFLPRPGSRFRSHRHGEALPDAQECILDYYGHLGAGALRIRFEEALRGLPTRAAVVGPNGEKESIMVVAYSCWDGIPWPAFSISAIRSPGSVQIRAVRLVSVAPASISEPLRLHIGANIPVFDFIGQNMRFVTAKYRCQWPDYWMDLLALDGPEAVPPTTKSHASQPHQEPASRTLIVGVAMAVLGGGLIAWVIARKRAWRNTAWWRLSVLLLGIGLVSCGSRPSEQFTVSVGEILPDTRSLVVPVELKNAGSQPWSIASVRRSCRCLDLEECEGSVVPPRSTRTIQIRFAPPDRFGPFEEALTFIPKESWAPTQVVRIQGVVAGEVEPATREIRLEHLRNQENRKFELSMLVAPTVQRGSLALASCPAWLTWRNLPVEGPRGRDVERMELTAHESLVGAWECRNVTLTWKTAEGRIGELPIQVTVSGKGDRALLPAVLDMRRSVADSFWIGTALADRPWEEPSAEGLASAEEGATMRVLLPSKGVVATAERGKDGGTEVRIRCSDAGSSLPVAFVAEWRGVTVRTLLRFRD